MRLDDFVTNPPHCIFCGTTTGPFDVEDVFPKWLRRLLPKQNKVTITNATLATEMRSTNVLLLKLDKAVCKRCNNGWMSQRENRTKRLIHKAIWGGDARLDLTRAEQADLAAWAAQKALLMDLALCQLGARQAIRYVTPGHLKWLYDHHDSTGEVPPGSRVWLFAQQPKNELGPTGKERSWHATLLTDLTYSWPTEPDGIAGDPEPSGIITTFTIGCLGFQVFLCNFTENKPDLTPPTPPPAIRPYLTRIAPSVYPRAPWPKTNHVVNGPDNFLAFSTWDGDLGIDRGKTIPAERTVDEEPPK